MADQIPNSNDIEKSDDLSQLLILYTLVFEKHNQEGDGIWARFNIIIGINLALLGAFAYVLSASPRLVLWREIGIGISIAGFFISSWSFFVLHELWLWHEYWRDVCSEIEKSFPQKKAWVRSHSEIQNKLRRNVALYRGWLPPYTQPFILVFALIWVATFVLLLTGWM